MTNPINPAPQHASAQNPYAGATPGRNASWAQRAVGSLVDAVILAPGWLLYIIGAGIGGIGTLVMLLGLVVMLGLGLYLVYLEGTTGQSIGKRRTNIRLISEQTGQPIGFGPAMLRKLCHLVDSVVCYLGWLWPLWDHKQQTLADKIVGTVVVPTR